jgi:3',5'-cyclic AMP phosphodiesterase CpdA
MSDFTQYFIDTSDGRFIFLDKHNAGSHAGALCEPRLMWLDQTLADAGPKPVYIFMHHPPHALGLPKQDEIKLQDADAFFEIVLKHANVKHLFMGHVHRPTCGTVKGIPFATIGAVSFQAPPPKPDWDWDSFRPPEEAPHLAVLDVVNGDVTLQYIQFCRFEVGMRQAQPV